MRKGFIFNHDLCVNCKSCSAACVLENSFSIVPRTVFTLNQEAEANLPLINLSIACNHCEIPVCLDGCPSSAYFRDLQSGAVIIDDSKCIGCRYCLWNCPYDAPKYDPAKRITGKCHLCYSGFDSGMRPACTNACPTGALSFGDIDAEDSGARPAWFPPVTIKPSLKFAGRMKDVPLRVVPASHFKERNTMKNYPAKSRDSEWSLVLFSFLTMLSVSIITSTLIRGLLPDKILFMAVTLSAGFFSFFHLGRWTRAWRSVVNFRKSPLSREIVLFTFYTVISCFSVLYEVLWLLFISSLTGLLLLILIDSVYYYARNSKVLLHSGQTFLSSLLTISFLSGNAIPFLFIAVIKIILSFNLISRNYHTGSISALRFVRITFLLIAGASLISGISYSELPVLFIFISGELLDRILFYFDFETQGLIPFMNKYLTELPHEKESD